MKKLMVLTALLIICLVGCSQKAVDVPVGVYRLADSQEIITPSISLSNDGTFVFEYSVLMSSIPMGDYKVSGDLVTLTRRDTGTKFTFQYLDEKLIFLADQSAEVVLAQGGKLETGAAFVPDKTAQ